jgi:hypothetical protein
MTRRKVYALVSGIAAIAAVALLLAFVVIPGSSTGTESTTVAATPGSPSEGITVHGHWTVDVLNPDGSLAEHREFENALAVDGRYLLSTILAGKLTPGPWLIMIDGTNSPCKYQNTNSSCMICEPGDNDATKSNFFSNLTVNFASTSTTTTLLFNGSITVTNTSNIDKVYTYLRHCGPNISHEDCNGSNIVSGFYNFTNAVLSPTIAVQAGQIIQVSIVISFQ